MRPGRSESKLSFNPFFEPAYLDLVWVWICRSNTTNAAPCADMQIMTSPQYGPQHPALHPATHMPCTSAKHLYCETLAQFVVHYFSKSICTLET